MDGEKRTHGCFVLVQTGRRSSPDAVNVALLHKTGDKEGEDSLVLQKHTTSSICSVLLESRRNTT